MPARAFIVGCSGLALTADERAFLRDAEPWGLILFGRNVGDAEQIRALVDDFRDAVGHADAPVLIDQEGGRVQRIRPPLARSHPPAARYGELYARDPEAGVAAARIGAELMAGELVAMGITVDCLPVLDLPVDGMTQAIGDRAYADAPEAVAALGQAVIEGMLAGGVLPVIKHMPGHGRATVDSHYHLPRVTADRATLEARDFAPFRALNRAPVGMTGHLVFEAIDPDRPATLSPIVLSEIVRGCIGFDGLLMSDDLSMKALSGPVGASAVGALAAGCDLALHCNGDMGEMREVAAAAPRLAGRSAERAAAALALIATPAGADLVALADQRDRLLERATA
ncbi:beta-N-acetylhexosaminidase [Methylopila capsulata]|uniref:beta-N-acetylhexosaminidase n=1 Tax=Methylopila capsulata TaxID=61654 RepID=A0A9W6MRH0_9HYPH|nr:beta-N-acetylhexosaminidase [Methylopila capsulata]MBM7850412.1 beta-N-acetylhexosaminidase [Methylopila capsulata]GLK55705.1 beta-N-acetylhexosaminidase [Methylopila capsulata]